MDIIMYDAQRQGRLSFYMVNIRLIPDGMLAGHSLMSNRSQQVKKASQLAQHQLLHPRMLYFANIERLVSLNSAAFHFQNL